MSHIDKVAVLFGGESAEREVSLQSGKAVLNALLEKGVDAHGLDTKNYAITELKRDGFTKAFIALHGRGGEDGITQAILNYQNIPYTGSDVLSSAVTMDKLKTKQIWQSSHLPVANYITLERGEDICCDLIIKQLGSPLFIKPNREGSSVGMSKVTDLQALKPAIEHAFKYDDSIMIEAFLSGSEYTVAIVGDEVLPVVKIEPEAEFYDYNAKYISDNTQYFCPCGLDEKKELEVKKLALKAYKAVGCRGWGRVDVMFDSDEKPYLLEVNTSPGMTSHSLVPMAAKQNGWSFNELVYRILLLAKV